MGNIQGQSLTVPPDRDSQCRDSDSEPGKIPLEAFAGRYLKSVPCAEHQYKNCLFINNNKQFLYWLFFSCMYMYIEGVNSAAVLRWVRNRKRRRMRGRRTLSLSSWMVLLVMKNMGFPASFFAETDDEEPIALSIEFQNWQMAWRRTYSVIYWIPKLTNGIPYGTQECW